MHEGSVVAHQIDQEHVPKRLMPKLSQREIARWLGVPRSTLQDRVK